MKTKKYLVIAHDILSEISHSEIFEVLGKEATKENTKIISFRNEIELKHGETMGVSWRSLKAEQTQFFKNEIQPLFEEYQEYEIAYFGLAPISLAIHLGYLMSGFKKVNVFIKHHIDKNWKWSEESTEEPLMVNLPKEQFIAEGDITLRFATSYVVNSESTKDLVVDPLRDVYLTAPSPGVDLFGSEEALKIYVGQFRFVIDELVNQLPKVTAIHLFASIPVGLGFLIGQEISPTIHPAINVYEYSRDNIPPYREAFSIQGTEAIELVIPDDRIPEIMMLRELLTKELENVKGFAENQITHEKNWFRNLFATVRYSLFDSQLWNPLAAIGDTNLKNSKITDKSHDPKEAKFYVNGKWYFSDVFLYQLIAQFADDQLLSAVRLFWFHEVLHTETHVITSQNSEEIGRYPRILEEADYQADVYALLNEFKIQRIQNKDAHDFFVRTIQTMIDTMWTFDELEKHDEIQVRRMNRYLIWYFLLCLIEKAPIELEEILDILSRKPLLEMKLHGITTADRKRIMFNLKIDGDRRKELGIAVFHQNRMAKHGNNGGQLSLDRLIDGFRERDNVAIKDVMCQLISEIS